MGCCIDVLANFLLAKEVKVSPTFHELVLGSKRSWNYEILYAGLQYQSELLLHVRYYHVSVSGFAQRCPLRKTERMAPLLYVCSSMTTQCSYHNLTKAQHGSAQLLIMLSKHAKAAMFATTSSSYQLWSKSGESCNFLGSTAIETLPKQRRGLCSHCGQSATVWLEHTRLKTTLRERRSEGVEGCVDLGSASARGQVRWRLVSDERPLDVGEEGVRLDLLRAADSP